MGMRTNSERVADVLGNDYDGQTNLIPRIRAASMMVDFVAQLAPQRGVNYTTNQLIEIETWVAAYLYAISDKPYQQNATENASATYQGQTGKGMEANFYGQTALRLDWSGVLEALDKRKIAKGFWPGTDPCTCPPPDPGFGMGPY